jgi:hypothetical protein
MVKRTLELVVAGDADAHARASSALRQLPGLLETSSDGDRLRLGYELRMTNCAAILASLQAAGLTLRLTALGRIRLGLRCYREAVLKEDLNNDIGWNSFVREIYVSRYRHRRHGRRDDRPRHWRQYKTRSQ